MLLHIYYFAADIYYFYIIFMPSHSMLYCHYMLPPLPPCHYFHYAYYADAAIVIFAITPLIFITPLFISRH